MFSSTCCRVISGRLTFVMYFCVPASSFAETSSHEEKLQSPLNFGRVQPGGVGNEHDLEGMQTPLAHPRDGLYDFGKDRTKRRFAIATERHFLEFHKFRRQLPKPRNLAHAVLTTRPSIVVNGWS